MAESIYEIQLQVEGTRQAEQQFQSMEGSMRKLGAAIGLAGAALTTFSANAAKMAAEYQRDLAALRSVSTEATGTTEEFGQALSNLSNEMDGAISITEGAKASYDILSKGIKDQATVMEILRQSQKTAIGGFSSLEEITGATTSVMNSFSNELENVGNQQEQVKFITDQIIQTQNLGSITAGEYAGQVGRIGSIASTAGVSLTELNAAIATSTAKGTQAESAFAGLKGMISNILKPTKEAQETAAKLGIDFGAAALKSKGLKGVLLEISQALKQVDGPSSEVLSKLFTDQEAFGVATQITGENVKDFTNNIQEMGEAGGEVDKAYSDLANTTFQEAQRAWNKLQNNMVEFGKGALVAFEPVIEAANGLLNVLNNLDPVTKQFVGTATALGGATATAVGGIAALNAAYGAFNTMLSTNVIPAVSSFITSVGSMGRAITAVATTQVTLTGAITATNTALTASLARFGAAIVSVKSYTAATVAAAGGTKVLIAKLGILAGSLAAVGGAVIALRKHMDNMNTELEGLEVKGKLDEIGPLMSKTQQLISQMEKTGEAIPQDKFQQWEDSLINARKEVGKNTKAGKILGNTLDAFRNKQDAAKAATEESNQSLRESKAATEESSQSTEESTNKIEKAKKAFEEYKESIDSTVESLEKQAEVDTQRVELSDGSESSKIQQKLEIQKQATQQQIVLLQDLANQSQASAEVRKEAEQKVTDKKLELLQKQQQAQERLQSLRFEKERALQQTAVAEAKARWEAEGKAFTETYQQRQRLARETFQVEKNILQQQISQAAKGSTERAKLQQELAEKRRQHLQEINSLEEKFQKKQIERIREQAQIRNSGNQEQLAKLEAQWERTGATILETFEQRKRLAQEASQIEIDAIKSKLQVVESGSQREAELQQQLAEAKRNSIQEIGDLQNQFYEAQAEKQQQAIEAERRRLELSRQQSEIRQSEFDVQNQSIESQSSLLSEIQSKLNSNNTSLEVRKDLMSFVEDLTGKNLRNSSNQLDVGKAKNAIEKKLANLEERKLQLKIEQLKNDREQLRIKTQMEQLELESKITGVEGEIKSAENPEERSRLENRKKILEEQKELAKKQLKVQDEGLKQQIESAKNQKELQRIVNQNAGETVKDLSKSHDKLSKDITGSINRAGDKVSSNMSFFQQQQEKQIREFQRFAEKSLKESGLEKKEIGDTRTTSFTSRSDKKVRELFPNSLNPSDAGRGKIVDTGTDSSGNPTNTQKGTTSGGGAGFGGAGMKGFFAREQHEGGLTADYINRLNEGIESSNKDIKNQVENTNKTVSESIGNFGATMQEQTAEIKKPNEDPGVKQLNEKVGNMEQNLVGSLQSLPREIGNNIPQQRPRGRDKN